MSPTPPARLSPLLYEEVLRRALKEDLGRAGDITTDALVEPDLRGRARVVARRTGRVAGLDVAGAAFRCLDETTRFEVSTADGEQARAGQLIGTVEASTRSILTAERVALNFLGHLSGIATATAEVVAAVEGYPTRVTSTRKTTPGLRALEKYAVRVGGGTNHRFGLDDAVLIKDNHLALVGSLPLAIQRVRSAIGHMVKVQVEVDTLEQLEEALRCPIDAVLLDNMSRVDLREAVEMVNGRIVTEASGNITTDTAREIAATGVDLISVGWLTHSASVLDVALELHV